MDQGREGIPVLATSERSIAVRFRRVRLLGALILGASLFVGAWVGAMQNADGVVLTVHAAKDPFDRAPTLVFSRVIRDASQAHEIQALVNGVPRRNPFQNVSCGIGGIHPVLSYDFRFTWHGIPIERATVDTTSCSYWSINTLGVPSLLARYDLPTNEWNRLHVVTGMPIPAGWE